MDARRVGHHAERVSSSLVTFKSAPGLTLRAARFVAAVGLGLVACCLILGPEHGMLGLLGAMSANAGRLDPWRRRLPTLIVVIATTAICQSIGVAIANTVWLIPPVMAVLTAVVVWAWHAQLTGPPGPLNTLFAGAFGAYMGSEGYTIGTLVPITVLGGVLAGAASMLILAVAPLAPAREAVVQADRAITDYLDPDDDAPEGSTAREQAKAKAYAAVSSAWQVLRVGLAPGRHQPSSEGRALERDLESGERALVHRLHADAFPGVEFRASADELPLGRPSLTYLLRRALQWGSWPQLVAARATIAVLLAASMMIASPVGHPYWAILSSLIVLHMGASRYDMTIRAAQRVLGTAIGVGVYFLVVLAAPSPWVKVAIVIAAIFIMESLMARNYAAGVIFVTLFALLMTPITAAGEVEMLMRDRLVETLVGVGVAVVVVWAVGRRAPVLLVRAHYRRTLHALLRPLDDLARGRTDGLPFHQDRRNLIFELGRSSSILAAARPDDPAQLNHWRPVEEQVASLAFAVFAECWHGARGPLPAAARARRQLMQLLRSLPPVSSQTIDTVAFVQNLSDIQHAFIAAAHGADDARSGAAPTTDG